MSLDMQPIRVTVNGATSDLAIPTDRLLIELLRDDLGLVGTKLGCEVGVCGLCAVIVDGALVSACLILAVLVDGSRIETVEGLAGSDGQLSAVQQAFIRRGGFQCGICTPGQVMTATALLRERPDATAAEIREWMSGSLCRCTGYDGIFDAVASVAGSGMPP